MNTLETLIASRAVIADEANWCKYIRDNHSGAHCALGAIDSALGVGRCADDHAATEALATAMTPDEIEIAYAECKANHGSLKLKANGLVAQFNNGTTHDRVLALWDRAIERQKLIEEMGKTPKNERAMALSKA